MSEIISIHVGSAGLQLGHQAWSLFCLEHNIQSDGILKSGFTPKNNSFQKFFKETRSKKYQSRSLFLDTEPNIIDQLKLGENRQIYRSDFFVSGKQGAGNNYAKGYYKLGQQLIDIALQKIKVLVQQAQSPEGFLIYNSLGGGTGTGFTSLLLQRLKNIYEKKKILNISILPSSKISTSVIQPYNTVLGIKKQLQLSDGTLLFDNQALYDICTNKLVENPQLKNLNKVCTQAISSATTHMRFHGYINTSIDQICKNLIPFYRFNFFQSSFAPIMSTYKGYQDFSVHYLTVSCFNKSNFLLKIDPRQGQYMACTIMHQGDLTPRQACLCNIKTDRTIRFVDWMPTGTKVGINYEKPIYIADGSKQRIKVSCCILSNNTAISKKFTEVKQKFVLMYSKKEYVNLFQEQGMNADIFQQVKEDLETLEKDYQEAQKQVEQTDQNENN